MKVPSQREYPSAVGPAGRNGRDHQTILVPELRCLLLLARVDALSLLHEIGGMVVIPDTVRHELTHRATPEASRLRQWIARGLAPGTNAPVGIETTDFGEALRLAQLVKSDFHAERSCGIAALSWLMDRVASSKEAMLVLSDRASTHSLLASEKGPDRIEVMTTDTLREQAGERDGAASNGAA